MIHSNHRHLIDPRPITGGPLRGRFVAEANLMGDRSHPSEMRTFPATFSRLYRASHYSRGCILAYAVCYSMPELRALLRGVTPSFQTSGYQFPRRRELQ